MKKLPVFCKPEVFAEGDYSYTVSGDGTAVIKEYKGSGAELHIPCRLGGRNVAAIGDRAFCRCRSLVAVTIPEGVTSIGKYAFHDCASLVAVAIPDSVRDMGIDPFSGCARLATINVSPASESLAVIDGVLFSKPDKRLVTYPMAKADTAYTVPEGTAAIGAGAFSSCESLISVIIPEGVTTIGEQAFAGCESLAAVTLPDSVTSVSNSAFWGCGSLETIRLPQGVTSIDNAAFCHCSRLAALSIPDSVIYIGSEVFFDCPGLTATVVRGSYAEQYCRDNGIKYNYTDRPD